MSREEEVPVTGSEAELRDEFDRQVGSLLRSAYPKLAGMGADEFVQHIAPLKKRLPDLAGSGNDASIPFVITIRNEAVATEKALPLVELGGQRGLVDMHPTESNDFTPIEGIELPDSLAYLVADIDTGASTLNVTPDEAIAMIVRENRSPLTIDEGVALITHYPEILKTKNCFSLLGSRRGDRRVPALWISSGSPRLGWCWAGNPHTWLGSASCANRLGA
jgi:hypothetical protein